MSDYRNRASKRRRTLGHDALVGVAGNLVADMMEDRRRRGRKQYRWTDLQGTDRVEMLRMIRDLALAAATNFEIAQAFGVKEGTLIDWVARDPEFAIAMRLPRDLADDRVEKAIYHRAVGYTFQSEEIKVINDKVVRVPVNKHIPPDIAAATFWLKNRRGHIWKDKFDVDAHVDVDVELVDKTQDPRALAMAVLDTLQQAIYGRIPATIDGEPVVAKKRMAEYDDAELERMTPEQIQALFEAEEEDDGQ